MIFVPPRSTHPCGLHLLLCSWGYSHKQGVSIAAKCEMCHRDIAQVISLVLFVYLFGNSYGSMLPILAEEMWRQMEQQLQNVC